MFSEEIQGGKENATSERCGCRDTKREKKSELIFNYLDVERGQLYVFTSGVGVVIYAQSCSRKRVKDGLYGHVNKINQK